LPPGRLPGNNPSQLNARSRRWRGRKENSLQYRVAQGLDSDVEIKTAKAGKVYDHRTGGALVRDDILHFPGAAYLATDETEGGEKNREG
jgi:hypothetical protein